MDPSAFVSSRNALLGETVVKNLKNRHFNAWYCATKEEAAAQALSLIAEKSTVTWGGSMSIYECGLVDRLKQGDYHILDRDTAPQEEKAAIMRAAFSCDTFLMSANAISQTGELVNIDGNGNRLAALCYGPKQVIVIAGINKIAPTLEEAVSRARHTAAPLNTQRFDLCTPCRKTGACADCIGEDSICAELLITRLSRPAGRINVILVGEPLGF